MLLLVDLDGVVYRGTQAVPGVAGVLKRRAAAGDRIMYVTNNSRWHREDYRARLEGHGVPLGDGWDSIVTAARAAAVLLAERDPKPRVAMVFGGPGLARELRDVGIRTVGPTPHGLAAKPDVLVVGVDFQLTYERLSTAVEAVRRGALFVATNRDPSTPVPTEPHGRRRRHGRGRRRGGHARARRRRRQARAPPFRGRRRSCRHAA